MIQFVENQGRDGANHLTLLVEQMGKAQNVWMVFPFWSTMTLGDLFERIYPRIDEPPERRKVLHLKWLVSLDDCSLVQRSSDAESFARLKSDLVDTGLITLECRYFKPSIRHGSLHAKMFVFDDRTILVSSANPTKNGLSKNMEAGIITDELNVVKPALAMIQDKWSRGKPLTFERAQEIACDANAAREVLKSQREELENVNLNIEESFFVTPVLGGGASFTGIDSKWFDHFVTGEPTSKDAVQANCEELSELLEHPFRLLWKDLRGRLTAEIGGLHFHFSHRAQLRNRYPTHMWFGISRDKRKYVPISHLACGIGIEEGESVLYVSFNLNEELGENTERESWIQALSANRLDTLPVLKRLAGYDLSYELGENRKDIPCPTLTESVVDDLVSRSGDRLDISISRRYKLKEHQKLLSSPSVVDVIADQLGALFPLMKFH